MLPSIALPAPGIAASAAAAESRTPATSAGKTSAMVSNGHLSAFSQRSVSTLLPMDPRTSARSMDNSSSSSSFLPVQCGTKPRSEAARNYSSCTSPSLCSHRAPSSCRWTRICRRHQVPRRQRFLSLRCWQVTDVCTSLDQRSVRIAALGPLDRRNLDRRNLCLACHASACQVLTLFARTLNDQHQTLLLQESQSGRSAP